MADLRLEFDPETFAGDLVVDRFGGLELDHGLATAVYLSLFCDRRAEESDRLPTGPPKGDSWPDRRGWWGDSFSPVKGHPLGSRLWLLRRESLTRETIARARQYVLEALEWLLVLEIASEIDVSVGVPSPGRLEIRVAITGPDGADSEYSYLWDAMRHGV